MNHHTAESDSLGNPVEDLGSANLNLRGSDLKNDDDPVGVIMQLKRLVRSVSTGLGTIQGSYNNGDIEGAGKALRDVVSGADSFVKTANDMKQLENIEGLPEAPFELSGIQSLIPEDISDSMLGTHMQPHVIEKLAGLSIELMKNLEDMDVSLLAKVAASSKKKKMNIKGSKSILNKSKPGLKKEHHDFSSPFAFKADSNQFSFSNAHGTFANFMKNPNMQSINKQTRFQ